MDLCRGEYSKCPLLANGPCGCATGRATAQSVMLCSTLDHTSVRCCLKSLTSCTFVWYTCYWIMPPDIINWIEVMAVRRPQIWRNECMAVGFIRLLHTPSLQTLQIKITTYDNHYSGLGETRLSWYLVRGRPSWLSVSSSIASTLSSVCVHFSLQLPCLRLVLRVSRSLLSNVSSPPFVQFYPNIQPVIFTNVQHKAAPKR